MQQDLDLRLQLSNSGREPKLSWSKQAHANNIEKKLEFIQYPGPDITCPRILNIQVDMQGKYRYVYICLIYYL